jgi:hypothetical protein
MTTLHVFKSTVQANSSRRIVHNGRDHVVVPVVMIVEGVLNNALVTAQEFAKTVDAWNDKPVPVLHPEVNGEYVSVGSPDIIEKSVMGRVYNARVEGDKLLGDLYLDVPQAEAIGRGALLAMLESGENVEVSSAYYSAREDKQGDFNGKPYLYIDRDLMPDHLALLPSEVGACSLEDGCGTNRPNVFKRIAEAFGLRTNQDEDTNMCTKTERVEKLVGNAKLTPELFDALTSAGEEELAMIEALTTALRSSAPAPVDMMDEEEEEQPAAMQANTLTLEAISDLIDSKLAVNSSAPVIARIVANEANVLSESTLKAMSKEDLEKYESSIRPVDYSGGAGVIVNTGEGDVSPLVPRKSMKKAEAK